MGENIIFIFIACLCGFTFIGLGIFSLKRKSPMHFWSGSTVKESEISDVRAYNKANAIMWITYGMIYLIAAILQPILGGSTGVIILGLACFPGFIILIFVYLQIYKKYEIKKID